jgi:hypothetical protein
MEFILDSSKVGKKQLFEATTDCERYEWEDDMDYISSFMENVEEWYCEVKNFGWRSMDGFKTFHAADGSGLMQAILPNTSCTFRVYRYGRNGLAINNAHHDSPTWDEWYYIVPMTKKLQSQLDKLER